MAASRSPVTEGQQREHEGRQPWLFFALLLFVPLVLVILITAFDVSVYLESWVSSILD